MRKLGLEQSFNGKNSILPTSRATGTVWLAMEHSLMANKMPWGDSPSIWIMTYQEPETPLNDLMPLISTPFVSTITEKKEAEALRSIEQAIRINAAEIRK